MRRHLEILGTVLFFIAWINFVVFWVVAVSIGGDAISGKVEGNRYYLSNHGKLTEVSHRVWNYARAHTISTFIALPIGAFVGGGLIAYSQRTKAA